MISSDSWLASDSTIIRRRSRYRDHQVRSELFTQPGRTIQDIAAILVTNARGADRPWNGAPEIASAADVPINEGISGSTRGLSDLTVQMTWVSAVKFFGNKGRIGRSIRREVRISFFRGRPSRRKNHRESCPAA